MAKVQHAFYYFVGETANRFAQLQSVFSAPITELYLLFYQSALQVFLHFNMFRQREDPLIPMIHKQMMSFLTKLATIIKLQSGIFAAYHTKTQLSSFQMVLLIQCFGS